MSLWPEALRKHRQKLARVVLLGATLIVGLTVWAEVPRDTELEYDLGDRHTEVVELRIAYMRDGEPYHGVRFGYSTGAPPRVSHRVSLPSGQFNIQLDVRERGGATHRSIRRLDTPADGLVRIQVHDPP